MNTLESLKDDKGLAMMAVIRIILGLMLLWGFFDKLFGLGLETPAGHGMIDGGSPSYFITYFDGPFAEAMHGIAGNMFIDILLMAGLLFIGLGLLLGIAMKLTTIFGVVFMFVMYLISLFPSDNPILDYHLAYVFAMVAIYYYKAGDQLGLGTWWKNLGIVKRYPILQ